MTIKLWENNKTPTGQKMFLGVWGDGYCGDNGADVDIRPIESFGEDMGYDFDVIEKLDQLFIGQSLDCSDINIHTVVRVK